MELISVTSSNLAAIGYAEESSTLVVEFLNGSKYEYYGVPENVFQSMLMADSKGKFLDQHIKKAGYSYSRI